MEAAEARVDKMSNPDGTRLKAAQRAKALENIFVPEVLSTDERLRDGSFVAGKIKVEGKFEGVPYSVDVGRESGLRVLSHTHNRIEIELPSVLGGATPTRDLTTYLFHTDEDPETYSRHYHMVNLIQRKIRRARQLGVVVDKYHRYHRALRRVRRKLNAIKLVEPRETLPGGVFSYQQPVFHSITNHFASDRAEWKREDGGSTDGWYADLVGKNFGHGCGGACNETLLSSQNTMGIIRHTVLGYDASDEKQYSINEIDWHTAKNPSFDCTCMQKRGEQAMLPSCDPFEIMQCTQILWWDHTRIEFFVPKGVGRGLALQLETGGQKSCSFRRRPGLETPAELRWCKPHASGIAMGCEDMSLNSGQPYELQLDDEQNTACMEFLPRSMLKTMEKELGKAKVKDRMNFMDVVNNKYFWAAAKQGDFPEWKKCDRRAVKSGFVGEFMGEDFKKECAPNPLYDPERCYCVGDDVDTEIVGQSMYGGPWTLTPGGPKRNPHPPFQGRYFDTWSNKFKWQWQPAVEESVWPFTHMGDLVPMEQSEAANMKSHHMYGMSYPQVTVNYEVPVLDKITPDTLAGHTQVSSVKLSQLTQEERDSMINQTTGAAFEIGDPGEVITITGTGFGVIENIPLVEIDGMRCREAILEASDKYPPGNGEKGYVGEHPLPALKLICEAPITMVGPKGYDERINAMRMLIKVGEQEAIINPDLDAPTKKFLLATLCRRGQYGREYEKCTACPAAATKTKAAGAECMGGMGLEAEPRPAPYHFSLPLIKDDLTWQGNLTRSSMAFEGSPITNFTGTNGIEQPLIERDGKDRFAASVLDTYTSFCGRTPKPNGTACEVDSAGNLVDREKADNGECILPGQWPPDAFWIGEDFKTCIHYYGAGNPGATAWGGSGEESMTVKCEGKGSQCCLSRWCEASQAIDGLGVREKTHPLQGWSFAKKALYPGESEPQGCIIPLTYGDPRYYMSNEPPPEEETNKKRPSCRSTTFGWWVWEEDRISTGRLPKRIKEQELSGCGPSPGTQCDPPYVVTSTYKFGCLPRGATTSSQCLDAVNLRVEGGGSGGATAESTRRRLAANAQAVQREAEYTSIRRILARGIRKGSIMRSLAEEVDPDGLQEEDTEVDPASLQMEDVKPTGAMNRCHADRWSRAVCPYMVPCDPPEACIGDNMCAPGYVGKKCNKCDYGYFRTEGVCKGCASNPVMQAVLFLSAIVAAGIGFAVIKWLQINLGVISIGIDYFQIINLFGTPMIPWGKLLLTMFDYTSVFSMNLDLAAPDCIGAGMGPHQKWFLTMFLPLMVLFLLVGVVSIDLLIVTLKGAKTATGHNASKVKHKSRQLKENLKNQIEKRIVTCFSLFLSCFYLTYVTLSKKAMDIFNCQPSDPPDDPRAPTTYMTISPDQECWRPGTWETGMHVKMMPWAIACVICYSLAFPLFIYFKFSKNKRKIFEDQLLAAQDRGDRALSINDQERFRFRKRYSAMYENFRPQRWYWILVLLGRKLAICVCGLLFRRNPMFQLSVALIILFTCFTLQVLYRPFMSMDERAAVVKLASKRDYERGHKMLRKMAAFGDTGEIEQAKKRLAMEEQAQLMIAKSLTKSAKYFVNYNDVEAVFLICAIFICVSGIMFASGYFENEYYKAQGVVLQVVAFSVIIGSLL